MVNHFWRSKNLRKKIKLVQRKVNLFIPQCLLWWMRVLCKFNKITLEVLSIIAVQVKGIQNANKGKGVTYHFMNVNIRKSYNWILHNHEPWICLKDRASWTSQNSSWEVCMAACDLKLQPEKNFTVTICQLEELLTVQYPVYCWWYRK